MSWPLVDQTKLVVTRMTLRIDMPSPAGDELKAARIKAGLSQVDAVALMGYPVQSGRRGGLQSRT